MRYTAFVIQTLLSSLFLLGSCTSEQPKTKENTLYYNDGKIFRRYTTTDDKIEGKMVENYTDGHLKTERFFTHGLENGHTVVHYPDGKLKESQYFVNGLQQNGDTIFYEDGRPQFVVSFKDGKKDGYLRKWSPEGNLIYEARYEKDSIVEVKGQPIKTVH